MNDSERSQIHAAWLALPPAVRSKQASEDELLHFEERYGPIPADFRWFLSVCGGGPVGSEWVDDITKLTHSHDRFRQQSAPPIGWKMRDVFLVGWDGSGNPVGIHEPTGALLVEDHNFGGIHQMAESFSHFLLSAFSDSPGRA